jgi:hypothetical protein
LLRDPKNLDVVLKTDLSTAKIEIDVYDAVRYLLKSMLAPKHKTEETEFGELFAKAQPEVQTMMLATREMKKKAKPKRFMPPTWANRF